MTGMERFSRPNQTTCPNCNTVFSYPPENEGETTSCPYCHCAFRITPLLEVPITVVPVAEFAHVSIIDRQPMWMRPISATVGRLAAPATALVLGSLAMFKPGPKSTDLEVQEVALGFARASRDDVLELQLGSSMPLRNIERIWNRQGIGVIGKLLGTLLWPINETFKALFRADSYDPFAHSVALYHNDRALLAHELGHGEDFSNRRWRVLYAFGRYFPPILLYQEWLASTYGVRNLNERLLGQHVRRANRVLSGGFGSYVGGFVSTITFG